MSLLTRHLEQISLSSDSIATLPFPPPKIFTNALLAPHDITALIRDTEPHERALFSVPPPPPPTTSHADAKPTSTRRQTVFNVTGGEVTSSAATNSRIPRRNTAVAAVLGSDLNSEIRNVSQQKGDVNVEVLLRGAEKLGEVYVMDGAKEKIAELRTRYGRVKASVAHYEAKVARQTRELEKMNRRGDWEGESGDEEDEEMTEMAEGGQWFVTDEDLKREEEEIRELERKKKELEDRVSGMERDLGGLLR